MLVSITTKSPSALLQIKGLATKYTTVKWPIFMASLLVSPDLKENFSIQKFSPRELWRYQKNDVHSDYVLVGILLFYLKLTLWVWSSYLQISFTFFSIFFSAKFMKKNNDDNLFSYITHLTSISIGHSSFDSSACKHLISFHGLTKLITCKKLKTPKHIRSH